MTKLLLATLFTVTALFSQPTSIIYDDDCTNDADCALSTLPALFKFADRGSFKMLGMMASSANTTAAANLCIFASYYGYSTISGGHCSSGVPIGAYQGSLSCSNSCNTSAWSASLVGQYDAGDTRANYPSCITLYRTILAANTNVVIIETGFFTCLNGLLQSPADGISALTGAQMLQQNVSYFVIMGGGNPTGGEFNFESDPADTATFFSTVTSQNGYPPVWEVSVNQCTGTAAGPPTYGISTINPSRWVQANGGGNQSSICDAQAVLYAARGLSFGGTTYYSDGGSGTNTVNATTGTNSWSTATASGQHYLSNVASLAVLDAIFNGYQCSAGCVGFSALPPGSSIGTYIQGGVAVHGGTSVK